jgi:hypothetical protein
MPHIHMLDFVLWPAFREHAVEILEMQEHMEYLLDMCKTLRCDWYFAQAEAFQRNEETGMLDLCDLAKVGCALHFGYDDLLITSDNSARFDKLVCRAFFQTIRC